MTMYFIVMSKQFFNNIFDCCSFAMLCPLYVLSRICNNTDYLVIICLTVSEVVSKSLCIACYSVGNLSDSTHMRTAIT